ncbi:UNKNOWN [Stylonychia lemnae]|uniref:Uncharacterized protein n=1 Tax=Stylonychia lemnae TaxID=5949 RepID=A0A078AP52_STYLE|nr:UNKNOWN [Stylonychia lemnae]|eukprot:CDW83706.1 UNKNOWN [Stylonychia lemnae]
MKITQLLKTMTKQGQIAQRIAQLYQNSRRNKMKIYCKRQMKWKLEIFLMSQTKRAVRFIAPIFAKYALFIDHLQLFIVSYVINVLPHMIIILTL